MALTVDAGSPLLLEVEFSKAEPFKGYQKIDPNSATYTVISPINSTVASGTLTKYAVGKYYCNIQTLTNWSSGQYIVRINSIFTGSSDISVKEMAFELKTDYVT